MGDEIGGKPDSVRSRKIEGLMLSVINLASQ
jgi:hypothetical protein